MADTSGESVFALLIINPILELIDLCSILFGWESTPSDWSVVEGEVVFELALDFFDLLLDNVLELTHVKDSVALRHNLLHLLNHCLVVSAAPPGVHFQIF